MKLEDITPTWAKRQASENLDTLLATTASDFKPGETLWETLRLFPWSRFCAVDQQPSQQELIGFNEVFNLRSCFGRAIACFELAVRYHPQAEGASWREVRDDWFRSKLLNQWGQLYQGADPEQSWIDELLMYEEPHAVFAAGDYQFDPASMLLPARMQRSVSHGLDRGKYDPWDAIVACALVNQALAQPNHDLALDILDEADRHAPGLAIVRQARVRSLAFFGLFDQVELVINRLHEEGWRSARMFFALEAVNQRGNHLATKFYGERLWKLLSARLESEVVYV